MSLSTLFVLLLVLPFQSVAQEERWSDYPKQARPCLEAMNKMGDEKKFPELMGVSGVGELDCEISAMFANKSDIEKFEKWRKKKGLDPNHVIYKNRKINIAKEIGTIIHPRSPGFDYK